MKGNQSFYKYSWLKLSTEFLGMTYFCAILTSAIIFFYAMFTKQHQLSIFYYSVLISSPIALLIFLFSQYKKLRRLEFTTGQMRMIYLTRHEEYDLSELTFEQPPAGGLLVPDNRDDVRISDKNGKKLVDIDIQWRDQMKILTHLEDQNLYVTSVPMAVREGEKQFIKEAAGSGVKLFLMVVLMVLALLGIGSYGIWAAIPAIILFAVVFFNLFKLPEGMN